MKKLLLTLLMFVMFQSVASAEDGGLVKKSGMSIPDSRFEAYELDSSAIGYEYIDILDMSDDYILVVVENDEDIKFGVIDWEGKWLIKPGKFNTVMPGGGGMFLVKKYEGGNYGYTDKYGNYVVAPDFEHSSTFDSGLALAVRDGYRGYIDKTGEFVKAYEKEGNVRPADFVNGISFIYDTDGNFSIINNSFEILFELDGYSAVCNSVDGYVAAIKGNEVIVLDNTGREVYKDDKNLFDWGTMYEGRAFRITEENGKTFYELVDYINNSKISKLETELAVSMGKDHYIALVGDEKSGYNVGLYNTKLEKIFDFPKTSEDGIASVGNISGIRYSDSKVVLIKDRGTEIKKDEEKKYTSHTVVEKKPASNVFKVNSNAALINNVRRSLDSNNYNVRTYIKNDRIMLPTRIIMESMSSDVSWDGAARTVTISGEKRITMTVGKTEATIYEYSRDKRDYVERIVTIDAPPEITEDRVFVPLRFISEMSGEKVAWNNKGVAYVGKDTITDQEADSYISQMKDFIEGEEQS